MRKTKHTGRALLFLFALLLALPVSFRAEPMMMTAAQSPNIGINGFFSADKVQRGRTLQAAVVVEIPSGYHINSNRPLAKFLIPTSLKIEAPGGVRVGPVSYPRALLRSFSFSPDKLSVYEGRAILRFNVTVPANFGQGLMELRARLRYQSCNDEACFPPTTREIKLPISVVGAKDSVKRINGRIFGGRGR
ncbi:MAG TPA: protein-disulfide reductase DsbD N-terminal domain-containing protein [Pyrinomonadaceae bacterium]|nr:protein-disulfide reductase DsbD N-terminal domain-containing protein [Pyrinomonadaceae bacterium]